ncbi:hypothetical protein X798_06139 [Onchocerca flexuosa]|uniref:Uncharacterized protein n=1 Tax=Onchocerca flexuosa TaxID=387005 RepID=A0A238BQB8_9BILA|nr:hypothetical protein X798_06139 [Onchocerca flexuosa]
MQLDQLWDDQITLAIIRPDCYLDLYDGANITDTHRFLGGEISEEALVIQEIPEIADELVLIKGIAKDAVQDLKFLLFLPDKNIDPFLDYMDSYK